MFKMKFNSFKNFVILVLVVAAVYQTGQLWLGSSPGHNFFYSFNPFGGKNDGLKDAPRSPVDPETIIVGQGTDTFILLYGTLNTPVIKDTADSFIQGVVENVTDYYTEELKYEDYINNHCIIYNFSFDVRAKEYFYELTEHFFDEDTDFNSIIAVPSMSADAGQKVYLIDEKTQKAMVIESVDMGNNQLFNAINTLREEKMADSSSFSYRSTVKLKLNAYSGNQFLPEWAQKPQLYAPLVKTPVLQSGDNNFDNRLEEVMRPYFDNFAGVSIQEDRGNYTLDNKQTTVKYYPNGILEYYNFEPGTDGGQTLSTAYYVCKEFLNRDITLNTDIYLADVSWNSGQLVFSFNYSVNNLPVFIDDEIKQIIGSDYPVKVIMEDNKVKRYMRYYCNYSLDTETEAKSDKDFVYAFNLLSYGKEDGTIQIEELILGYYDTMGEDAGRFVWQTKMDGKTGYITTEMDVQEQ